MYDRVPLRQEDDRTIVLRQDDRIPLFRTDLQPNARRSAHAIRFLLFLCCLFVAGYFIVKQKPLASTRRDPAESAAAVAASAPVSLPPSEAEDLARHLENAAANLIKASEEIKRSQAWIGRTIPALDRNYLNTEKIRLQSATAASEAARRYAEQAREEVEIAKNVLTERRH